MCDLREALLEKKYFEETLGFEFESTFWEEFSIADQYGEKGVREHFNIAFPQWKDNLKYLIELVQVLNLKVAVWFGVDDSLGMTYDELWHKVDSYALENLSEEDLHTYLHTLD